MTEQVIVAVTLWACILVVLGLNLDKDLNYPD
jgi:hypothetical protein